jgi:hypothetical protein
VRILKNESILLRFFLVIATQFACAPRAKLSTNVNAFGKASLSGGVAATPAPADVANEIRTAATASNNPDSIPLPVVSGFECGACGPISGFHPSWQLDMIRRGHHLFPWFRLPNPNEILDDSKLAYFQPAIQQAAGLNLPLVFIGSQFERWLYDDPNYRNLPPTESAMVISPIDGTTQSTISPFGAIAPWQSIGKWYATGRVMQAIQQWYPTPPLVIFWSNNEANVLRIWNSDKDQRYLNLYGAGHDDNFKRQVFYIDGWKPRYQAMFEAWKSNLSPEWQSKIIFVAYGAGPWNMGMYKDWARYYSYVPGRIDAAPLIWDGSSAEIYHWRGVTDFTANSVQMVAQQFPFMKQEALTLNPTFWWEAITWYGGSDSINQYSQWGQTYSPERYGGTVQWNLWLLRPRVMRELGSPWCGGLANLEPWILPTIAAVDRVYNNATLESFWRFGQLVPNRSRTHHWMSNIPTEYRSADRMFMLTTDLDSPPPWNNTNLLPASALAYVLGSAPNRRWLLYIFSPEGSLTGVKVTIPGYKTVALRSTVAGSFYLINEWSDSVAPLENGSTDVRVRTETVATSRRRMGFP